MKTRFHSKICTICILKHSDTFQTYHTLISLFIHIFVSGQPNHEWRMLSSLNLESYANRDPEWRGWMGNNRIGEGKYKYVMGGTYDKSGFPAADKFLKSGTSFSSDCFLDDIRAAEAALHYVAGFHRYIETTPFRGIVSIKVNIPAVWEQGGGQLAGQKMLREPFIENFQKFNSNSDAVDVTALVAQALSHYSYHASDGTELLCDLQGGKVGDSYVFF